MQDNSSKVVIDIKSELKQLGRIVENLSRNYERLEREIQHLKQGKNLSTGATTREQTHGNIPPSTDSGM